MEKDLETRFTRLCDRFQLSSKTRKNTFNLMKDNPTMAEELIWLFQRKSANSITKLNCVLSAPPSLQPIVTVMLNYWKTEKIRRNVENRWPKPVTFVLPNQVICAIRKQRGLNCIPGPYPYRSQHDYYFEFEVKGQKVTMVREAQLIKQTIEMLVNNATVLTAKAWHWKYEGHDYPIDSREGKIFVSMIEQNIALEVAAVLTNKTSHSNS